MAGTAPKILLAKPGSSRPDVGAGSSVKVLRDDPRVPYGSLNLISDSWDIFPDRLLPLMTDNTDFTVVGVLGLPGVGKSTIMNELYGFDANSTGVLPPFAIQSEESKAMAKHCSVGVELRMSLERFILLDTQPVFSASVLTELMRPDGSSAVSVLTGETLSAELAHEIMGIQLGVFLASVCNVLLLVTEGLHDTSLWHLMLTVEMLKQGIPDPSLINATSSSILQQTQQMHLDKEADAALEDPSEFFADTIFIHTKLRDHECSWYNIKSLEKALASYFPSPAFRKNAAVQYIPHHLPFEIRSGKRGNNANESGVASTTSINPLQNGSFKKAEDDLDESMQSQKLEEGGSAHGGVNYFVLPLKASDDSARIQYESSTCMLRQLRDQILSMPRRSFGRAISEREWLRSTARLWDLIKRSPVLIDYSRTLQNSGLYRR